MTAKAFNNFRAFLNFRQSTKDTSNLDQHHICGRPLTMYEIDSNFAAIADNLEAFRTHFGLGGTKQFKDSLTIADIFKNGNDLNSIKSTGFYNVGVGSAHVPKTLPASSIVQHIENTDKIHNNQDVGALQIIPSPNDLMYRIKTGNTGWGDWKVFADKQYVDAKVHSIDGILNNVIGVDGGNINGSLNVSDCITAGNIRLHSSNIKRGDAPVSENQSGITFYDNQGIFDGDHRMAYVGLHQTADGYSGITLSANHPTKVGAEQYNQIRVGWKFNSSTLKYEPYSYAPNPTIINITDNPNAIATVGWVDHYVNDSLIRLDIFKNPITIENHDLTVEKDILCEGDVYGNVFYASEGIINEGNVLATIEDTKPDQVRFLTRSGNGFWVVDNVYNESDNSDVLNFTPFADHAVCRFYGYVDVQNTATAELGCYQWNKVDYVNPETADPDAKISISVYNDGTVSTYCPTPSKYSNTTEIATTEWVKKAVNSININGGIADSAIKDGDGNVITETYIHQDAVLKAKYDHMDNIIVDTYATKREVAKKAPIDNPVFTGNVMSPVFIGDLVGNVLATEVEATNVTVTSDGRLKNITQEVGDVDLSSLTAYQYSYKIDTTNRQVYGLIAQDVEQVLPHSVKTDQFGFKSIDYNSIVAVLVNKVNQLEQQIAELQKQK